MDSKNIGEDAGGPRMDHGRPTSPGWNFRVLAIALAIGVFLQWEMVLHGGKGFIGGHFYREARFNVALVFDGLVLLRMLVAAMLQERNRNWILYAFLCVASPWGILRLSAFLSRHYDI